MLSEDIDSVIQSSLRNDFKGITAVKGFRRPGTLSRALETESPSLLVVDGLLVESLPDFIREIDNRKPPYKILLILPSYSTQEDMQTLLDYANVVPHILLRPFTLQRLYTYLNDSFHFTKPKVVTVSQISADTLSKGMILAEDVYIPGGNEPLLDCGTVLDEASIRALIEKNIKNIKVHEDTAKFMNCWEVKKCGCVGECPASFFVDADGFLGGINAGRACVYLKYTKGPCVGIYKNIAEKIKILCSRCEFYKMLLKDNIDKIPIAELFKHVEKKKAPTIPSK
ncbi:MAG: hypothetical protein HQK96_01940 [Nitrospirae bacterium]|nr:hypothetical protein [Nitrospirota bacterium]MBF0553300.1 hypothetical protein [Nitrospirota bacterium]